MKKLLSLAGVLAVLTAAPAFANHHDGDHHMQAHKAMEEGMFKKMDANADGGVTEEENAAFAKKMFLEADANADGKVTKEECSAHHKKMMDEMHSSHSDRPMTSDETKANKK